MEHVFIESGKLEISPQNVRRTASKAAALELKSSILAHGLMQNLVVTASGNGSYRVIAGGRRLKAIHALQGEGLLPPDYTVPCQIAENKHALEMSLAENTVRLAMHPADEFEAFAKLVRNGSSVDQVAERFGVPVKQVEQRLKLGRLAPELLRAYRAEKLTLDCLMAFTLTDDRRRQLAVFETLEEWHDARQIRAMLTGGMLEAGSKLAAFVGLDAYHAAGGVSRGDLFCEEIYLESPDLLHRLAAGKFDCIRQQLVAEGWKWVEISPERDWEIIHRYGRIRPDVESDAYSPEQVQFAGCYVSLDHEGGVCVEKGLVRREDIKRVFPAETPSRKASSSMTATLRRDLEASRQFAAQVEIAGNRQIALDLLVFTTASKRFGGEFSSGLDVQFRWQTPAVSEASPAGDALRDIKRGLKLSWLEQHTEAACFAAFCQLGETEKLDVLAFCTATTLKPQLGDCEESTAYELALSLTAGNMAAYWRPTKANYLGRITRERLLAIGRELLGEAWAQSRNGDRKAVLAESLERVFAEPEKAARDAGQLASLKNWLPHGMAFAASVESAPAKLRKRKAA